LCLTQYQQGTYRILNLDEIKYKYAFFSSAQDDLKRATKLAFAQIKQYGMSKTFGLISFPVDQQNPQNDDFGVKPYSKRLQHMMDEVMICII